MEILEHPLEAFAFRLYSLPLPDASAATGAAAWTCLAAVLAAAAAAGLWRLRSSTPAVDTAALKPLELDTSKTEKEVSPKMKGSSLPDSAASTPAASWPKERYTAYYRGTGRVGCCGVYEDEGDEEEVVTEEDDEDDEDGAAYQSSEKTTGPFGWEQEVMRSLPLSPTAVEVGRYRSPTALSRSSIVRLWDEAIDAGVTAASPRRRSRVVGTISAF